MPFKLETRIVCCPVGGYGSRRIHCKGKVDMLILTRRPGETPKIGEEITVTVLAANGRQVRIDIDAPKDVTISREELVERAFTANAECRAIG